MSEQSSGEVLYRCTECGKTSVSIGWLHAHIDSKHHGFGPFNLIPNPLALGNFDRCMEKTIVLQVESASVVSLDEVENVS